MEQDRQPRNRAESDFTKNKTMHSLLLHAGETTETIPFEGSPLLSELLLFREEFPEQTCGGQGTCGKCSVYARLGSDIGPVPACQTRLTGDAEVWLERKKEEWYIEAGAASGAEKSGPADHENAEGMQPCLKQDGSRRKSIGPVGAAVDIGTTTLALKLLDLSNGEELASALAPNPQRKISGDVMGRIKASMNGQGPALQKMAEDAVTFLLKEACEKAGCRTEEIREKVLTGNTAMLKLITGGDPASLSKAPFRTDDVFGREEACGSLGTVYLPRCLHAFVGADTVCAILSCGLLSEKETALLCDIGTNGELVLRKNGKLYVTSTAAGPAFEGAGIRCGCGSIMGAIDHVTVEGGKIKIHTLGGGPALGLCGSGLIDAVSCGLELGLIAENGVLREPIQLEGKPALYPEDVRELQLAKAAVQAGIRTLLSVSGTEPEEIGRLYLAGGFGSRLDPASAARIGLIPEELVGKVRTAGNAALTGAELLLLDSTLRKEEGRIAALAEHVDLGGNPLFNDYYMESMLF